MASRLRPRLGNAKWWKRRKNAAVRELGIKTAPEFLKPLLALVSMAIDAILLIAFVVYLVLRGIIKLPVFEKLRNRVIKTK